MNTLMLTDHATVRMAQRGIKIKDFDLIALIGTPVDDGYLVRDQDCQGLERDSSSALGESVESDSSWLMAKSLQLIMRQENMNFGCCATPTNVNSIDN